MTNFLINNEIVAKGEMTVQQEVVGNTILVKGIMELTTYIEEIVQIETDLFCIAGVMITRETLGTNEKKVVYEFTGKGLGIDKDLFNSRKES